ncbi:hypothetical protein evm_005184 [Chilo suppressalis]|nr:hypothetical protein evm_005184 [Chilo suppressalis]
MISELRHHSSNLDFQQDVLEFMPSNRGKGQVLIYKGYTYANMGNKNRWYCSKKSRLGCKGKLWLKDGVVNHEYGHDHDPPKLFRTQDGNIIRI